jgi:hypothetical protein
MHARVSGMPVTVSSDGPVRRFAKRVACALVETLMMALLLTYISGTTPLQEQVPMVVVRALFGNLAPPLLLCFAMLVLRLMYGGTGFGLGRRACSVRINPRHGQV